MARRTTLSTTLPKLRRHARGCGHVRIRKVDYYLGSWPDPKSPPPDDVLEAYHRTIAEFMGSQQRFTIQTSTPTIAMLAVAFLKHAEVHYVDGSSTNEIVNFRLSLKPLLKLYGSTLVKSFGPKSLKAVRQAMIDSKLARRVVNQRIRRIKHVFKWGVEEELVPGEVWYQLSAVRGLQKGRTAARETPPVLPVSLEHFEAVVNASRSVVAAMARLQMLTGMRPAEVCSITPGQVDRSDKEMWIYRPAQHKTSWRDKVREIAIGPQGQAILTPYLLRGADEPCFTRAGMGNGKNTTSGSAYPPSDYGLYLRRVAQRIGIPPWSPNQIRHTRATELRRKYGLEISRVILGHSTPVVTEIYAEQDREAAMKVMREIG